MQATFTKSGFYNIKESAYKARDNQALLHQYSVLAETENGIRELVIARLYASLRRGANRVTCILWTNGGHNANASGLASGYGYRKGERSACGCDQQCGHKDFRKHCWVRGKSLARGFACHSSRRLP